jgi:L-seryl-tRNA(Ser) seleniumtransferase
MNVSANSINQQENTYTKLGIKLLINAQGTYTTLGGSLMPTEVLQAMTDAAGSFVSIEELQEKVGARIAALLKVPSAMVTAGAASAITVATAACMVREKPEAIDRLPDTDRLRNEVIIQKNHKCGYEPQCACLVQSSSGLKRSPSSKKRSIPTQRCSSS